TRGGFLPLVLREGPSIERQLRRRAKTGLFLRCVATNRIGCERGREKDMPRFLMRLPLQRRRTIADAIARSAVRKSNSPLPARPKKIQALAMSLGRVPQAAPPDTFAKRFPELGQRPQKEIQLDRLKLFLLDARCPQSGSPSFVV